MEYKWNRVKKKEKLTNMEKNTMEEAMLSYFDKKEAECLQRKMLLIEDERGDEARFEIIRTNVYGIFKTVFIHLIKSEKVNAENMQEYFLEKAVQISSNWREAYRKAKQYEDIEKMQIEDIKLETLKEIEEVLARIWEEGK